MSDQNAPSLPFASWLRSERAIPELQEAVSRLYESRAVVVFRAVLGITHCPEEAEDITHEAFLRLYIKLRDGAVIHSTIDWVVVVARNLARKRVKQLQRQASITDALADNVAYEGMNVEQELVEASRRQTWLQVRERLPATERSCLELHVLGATFKEIVATLGLPYRDAITRTKRAMEKFRRFVAEGR
jgi:RNA polymerase sigma factor (sigma-70 family)